MTMSQRPRVRRDPVGSRRPFIVVDGRGERRHRRELTLVLVAWMVVITALGLCVAYVLG
jgi:hypothetical protein